MYMCKCNVCLEAEDLKKMKTLNKCGHTFHEHCLLQLERKECPTCRGKFAIGEWTTSYYEDLVQISVSCDTCESTQAHACLPAIGPDQRVEIAIDRENTLVMSAGLAKKRMQQAEAAKEYVSKSLRDTLKHPIFSTATSSDEEGTDSEMNEASTADETRKRSMLINMAYHPSEEEYKIATRCMESAQGTFELGMKLTENNLTLSEALMSAQRDMFENLGRLQLDPNAKIRDLTQTMSRLQEIADKNMDNCTKGRQYLENAVHQAAIAEALMIAEK